MQEESQPPSHDWTRPAKVIPRPEHNVSRANISKPALKVLYRLKSSGYQAFLVGGGVRDLLLGREPKDFDIVTDASPEEVRQLFRNCRLIGRRFRLAHVRFGREIIEVATFRARADIHEEVDSDHVRDEGGRILRDNVYGDIDQDVWRRDFTANALYYSVALGSNWTRRPRPSSRGSGPKNLKGAELKTAVAAFVEKMKPHIAVAEETGVTIAIENHGNNLIESPDSLKYLAELRPSKRLGIAFAPYHLPQDPKLIADLIRDLGESIEMFYAWEHGDGCTTKLPKNQELKQMPGRGPLDFGPILKALVDIKYSGWTEIFMHPVPRGIPILETAAEVTAEINKSRAYLAEKLESGIDRELFTSATTVWRPLKAVPLCRRHAAALARLK